MAVKINFDTNYNAEYPTIVLGTKSGRFLGTIPACDLQFEDNMNSPSQMQFTVYKTDTQDKIWNDIQNLMLIWVKDWNTWFEIEVEVKDEESITKEITAASLGEAELSQINLYNIEINTESDIARDDYKPTVLFDEQNPDSSLLHRIMEKIPHYSIGHVDESIAKIQRTFSFNDKSIYDSLQDISKELDCIFIIKCYTNQNHVLIREINAYDLESYCLSCHKRGEFFSNCDKCNSTNILNGYGKDTTIFITSDNLANNIVLKTDVDSMKNCFKLEAGDDLMTAAIRNCNPNGTDYLWYFSDLMKAEMSDALLEKIEQYDELYNMYQNTYSMDFEGVTVMFDVYNFLIDKYKTYNADLNKITLPIVGYSSLMNAYYDTIDFAAFLQHSLMPTVEMSDTTALAEVGKLTTASLSPVAVTNISNISASTADSAVLAITKTIVDARYKVKISSSSIESNTQQNCSIWSGVFVVTNYSDETDTATSSTISVTVNDDYSTYVNQKIQKLLNNNNTDNYNITGLFGKPYSEFVTELRKYSLDCLNAFYNSCQSCIDILIDQGIADKNTWSGQSPNLYNDLYLQYLDRLSAIESEIKLRQEEINSIIGTYDSNGELVTKGIQNFLNDEKNNIQNVLDLKEYLGAELWLEICSFRREDVYSNDNYISDGLNNAELFERAYDFFQAAQKDIYKSSELQHSITASLKNLLMIKEFSPIVNYFEVGNWLRTKIDNEIYKLRLTKYSINYNDANNISVEFSDAVRASSIIASVQEVIAQASSMASSYSAIQRQASQGEKSSAVLNDWVSNGLNTTNTKIIGGSDNQTQTWDEHGLLFRKYDSINNTYDDVQLKIINSTIAITDDNWRTVKTAIGNYYYNDPITKELKNAYGINGELIMGNLLVGKNLSIYNESGNLSFNNNGFIVSNDINTVSIDPNAKSILNIKNRNIDTLSFDEDGNLVIMGNIAAQSLILLDGVNISSNKITGLSIVAVSGNYADLTGTPNLSDVALSGSYEDLDDKPVYATVAISGSYNDLSDKPDLALVATSGSYNDLDNKPDISGIEANAQSIQSIQTEIETLKAQIQALNEAVFNSGGTE